MRRTRRILPALLAGLVVTTALVVGVSTVSASASPGIQTTTRSLGPGMVLKEIFDSSGPTRISS